MNVRSSPELRLTEPQKRALLQLRIRGSQPRTLLGEALGMNPATTTRLIQQLLALDVVEEQDSLAIQARGRPTVPLRISGRGGWSVGATVQPGWLELAIVDFRGTPLVQDSMPFENPDPLEFARALDQQLRVRGAELGFKRGRFLGVGVAVPGYALHADRTRREVVSWLSGWRDVPLADLLSNALGMPVWIENDATAAALAEYYQPAIIERHRSALVFFLGHGVGAGVIAERDLLLGEHGNAGEVGRLFPPHLPRPSGVDLIRFLRESGVAIDSLADIEAIVDTHALLIGRWAGRVAQQLDQAVASGLAWLDPGAVIISGALPLSLLRDLADRVARLAPVRNRNYYAATPSIYHSPLGSAAVVIGAAMAPLHAVTALSI